MSKLSADLGLAAAAVLVFAAGAAGAQVCNSAYPIRATGAACQGPNVGFTGTRPDGQVFCCIASHPPAVRVPSNDRVASAVQLGGAMIEVLGALIGLIESSSASVGQELESDAVGRQFRLEKAEARRRATQWARSGLEQLRRGDDVSAEAHFEAAVRYASDGGDNAAANQYTRSLYAVRAQKELKWALVAKAEGRFNNAAAHLLLAASSANMAGRADLRDKIRQYRLQLNAQVNAGKSSNEKPFKEKTSCMNVNGQMLCD